MRHAVLEDACDSSATDISILQDTTRLYREDSTRAKLPVFSSSSFQPRAHTLLCVEKFAHLLQETEVVKEADEYVRFAVPKAGSSACLPHCLPHGHVSLYVTANTGKPAGREK